MKLLLDTSAFIWVAWNPNRLSSPAQELFKDKKNFCYLSHVSIWEMMIKFQLGKMDFDLSPALWVEKTCTEQEINLLPSSLEAIFTLPTLPFIHKDPFDRMLVAQALAHDMTLLSNDQHITQYNVKTAW